MNLLCKGIISSILICLSNLALSNDKNTKVVYNSICVKSVNKCFYFNTLGEFQFSLPVDAKSNKTLVFYDDYPVFIKNEDKFIAIDKSGNELHAISDAEEINGFSFNKKSYNQPFAYIKRDNKWGMLNTNYEYIIPVYDSYYPGEEGYITVSKNGQYGLVNSNNEVIIPIQYKWLGRFSSGVIPAKISDEKFVFLDVNGNRAFPNIYSDAKSFREGLAFVWKDGYASYINPQGQTAISLKDYDIKYKRGFKTINGFNEGLAIVLFEKQIGDTGYRGEHEVVINKSGEIVIPAERSYFSDFFNGLATKKEYGKDPVRRYIDKNGKIIVAGKDALDYYYGGLIYVNHDDGEALFSNTGQKIIAWKTKCDTNYLEDINGQLVYPEKTVLENKCQKYKRELEAEEADRKRRLERGCDHIYVGKRFYSGSYFGMATEHEVLGFSDKTMEVQALNLDTGRSWKTNCTEVD